MKNKKAQIEIMIIFIVLLFVILFLGFIMVVGSSIVNFIFDETIPELSNLGDVGGTNMSEVATFTIAPLNTLIQSFTWLTGILYMMLLIGSVVFVAIAKTSPSKWLIGFYFVLALILVLGSMFVSNMYEDFYDGSDDIADRLKEHVLLSYMILYSPLIFSIIVFITGIILFSGIGSDEFI